MHLTVDILGARGHKFKAGLMPRKISYVSCVSYVSVSVSLVVFNFRVLFVLVGSSVSVGCFVMRVSCSCFEVLVGFHVLVSRFWLYVSYVP